MEIRITNQSEFELSKKLWRICFPEDGADFINWFYRERTKPEYTLAAFMNGEIVSMMHIVPIRMVFFDKVEMVAFVSGVCTQPTYRRRGICGKLFDVAFDEMRRSGYKLTALQPFDTAFYERFGYRTYIKRRKICIREAKKANLPANTTRSSSPAEMLMRYNTFMSGYSGFSERHEGYFEKLIEEYSYDGAVLLCGDGGYCVGYGCDDEFSATELVAPITNGTVRISDIMKLLPSEYAKLKFPLPQNVRIDMSGHDDIDLKEVIEDFSMLSALDGCFSMDIEKMYGFDRY